MRHTQTEKMEIIRLVEGSSLSVRETLRELDVNRSSFYAWYRRYEQAGYDGLANKKPAASRFWNRIPVEVKDQVVSLANLLPGESPRQLAWKFTDREGYYLSGY